MGVQLKSQRKFKRNGTKWRSDTRLTVEQQQQVKENLPLVRMLARRLALKMAKSRSHREMLFEDFYSIGVEALCYAVDRFNPNAGYTFSTYAGTVINSDIQKNFAKDISKGITLKNDFRLKPKELIGAVLSLDQKIYTDENDVSLADAIPDPSSVTVNANNEDKLFIEQVLTCLTLREKQVFDLYYFEGLKRAQVGRHLGLRDSNVARILQRAKVKILARFTNL